jgi:Phage integrase, N-terminal SAM-like domain
MTDEAMSPLRRRMIEDMTIRKLAPKTQHDYVQRVKNFAAFLGRSPDTASFEDVRRYQLHLAAGGANVPALNQTVTTLRFFSRPQASAVVFDLAVSSRRAQSMLTDKTPGILCGVSCHRTVSGARRVQPFDQRGHTGCRDRAGHLVI